MMGVVVTADMIDVQDHDMVTILYQYLIHKGSLPCFQMLSLTHFTKMATGGHQIAWERQAGPGMVVRYFAVGINGMVTKRRWDSPRSVITNKTDRSGRLS